MKAVLVSILASAVMTFAAPAEPICHLPLPPCADGTSKFDPHAVGECNCAEKYCPPGPLVLAGDVWGWDEATNSCGSVPPGDQCAGVDVTCVTGYYYGWNGVDTCQCLPQTKRDIIHPVCRIACTSPHTNDPNAIPTTCNCDEIHCPPPTGPGGPFIGAGETWAFNATSDACGPVFDPDAECNSLDVECVSGYSYGWDSSDFVCKCLPEEVLEQRQICQIVCVEPRAYDPHGVSPICNCADRVCIPEGPELICPVNEIFGWDEAANECGCVLDPEAECEAVPSACIPGYTYGWNVTARSCECLVDPGLEQREVAICEIACILPEAHDPHAESPGCNCAERVCPPGPECSVGTSFGWDQSAGACGCVASPEAECEATDFTCVPGYTYDWNASAATCECQASDSLEKRICGLVCELPEAHDPFATGGCNCADRVCATAAPECPVDESFGWDQDANECGCVASPETQCEATGVTCISGYIYGWNIAAATCECLEIFEAR